MMLMTINVLLSVLFTVPDSNAWLLTKAGSNVRALNTGECITYIVTPVGLFTRVNFRLQPGLIKVGRRPSASQNSVIWQSNKKRTVLWAVCNRHATWLRQINIDPYEECWCQDERRCFGGRGGGPKWRSPSFLPSFLPHSLNLILAGIFADGVRHIPGQSSLGRRRGFLRGGAGDGRTSVITTRFTRAFNSRKILAYQPHKHAMSYAMLLKSFLSIYYHSSVN